MSLIREVALDYFILESSLDGVVRPLRYVIRTIIPDELKFLPIEQYLQSGSWGWDICLWSPDQSELLRLGIRHHHIMVVTHRQGSPDEVSRGELSLVILQME